MPAEIIHTLSIVGIGNYPNRRAVVNIDAKGILRCRIGCFEGTLKTGLKHVQQKYGKTSPYYKTLDNMGKELQRVKKRQGRHWRGRDQNLSYYYDKLGLVQ